MQCPGQDTRYWKPGDIFEATCPACGAAIEFFKDDSSRRCTACGARVLNPRCDFGCAAHCAFAAQCLLESGDRPAFAGFLRERVERDMRAYFGADTARIEHACEVTRYAARILETEPAADPAVVIAAALLHDIGIPEAQRRHDPDASRHHEALGPDIARTILQELHLPAELIREVCDIIGRHHHPRSDETVNYRIVFDADMLANTLSPENSTSGAAFPDESLYTEAARKIAARRGK